MLDLEFIIRAWFANVGDGPALEKSPRETFCGGLVGENAKPACTSLWSNIFDLTTGTFHLTHSTAMSTVCQNAIRRYALSARASSSQVTSRFPAACLHRQQQMSRRYESTTAAAASGNPKVAGIVDQISQLTLLETADLVSSLKVRSFDR